MPNAFAIEKKGIAPCRDACPAGQRAQGYIALIREGRWQDAMRVIKMDNPFPGICGRICNHRCETACNRNLVDEPLAIAALKRFVTDTVYAEPYQPPKPAQRKYEQRVAIIGSGPCGLTAAKDLVQAGYGVTVFEALPVAGGMLRVGVPEFRVPTWVVNREVQEIVDLGVELRLNTQVENLYKKIRSKKSDLPPIDIAYLRFANGKTLEDAVGNLQQRGIDDNILLVHLSPSSFSIRHRELRESMPSKKGDQAKNSWLFRKVVSSTK